MKFSKFKLIFGILVMTGYIAFSQTSVRIDIDASKPTKPVSPFIYGKKTNQTKFINHES